MTPRFRRLDNPGRPNHFDRLFRALDLSLLRAAAQLVPAGLRSDWRNEWRAELWHVRQAHSSNRSLRWQAEREIAAFCAGAFRDALCLRRQHSGTAPSNEFSPELRPDSRPESLTQSLSRRFRGSAAQCLLVMAAVLVASLAVALLDTGVRQQTDRLQWRVNPGLILIKSAQSNNAAPAVSARQYRLWQSSRQRYFDQLAFYSIARETVETSPDQNSSWTVAHSSANLFTMLGLPLRYTGRLPSTSPAIPTAILSCRAFQRDFSANPDRIPATIQFGSRIARIAGVAPCEPLPLPGNADAWLLQDDPTAAPGAKSAKGYVIAHLTPLGESQMESSAIAVTARNSTNDGDDEFLGVAIHASASGPWNIFLFMTLLAFLALPAVTSVSMGESNYTSHRPPRVRQLWRWSFLLVKLALLLPIAWYLPLDLAYWHVMAYPSAPEYVQLVTTFLIGLFGMRWMLLDQRQRCPVCLKRVTNPAQVGYASRTFLAWNGTEMICTGGHTLLHIPGLPTSWFGAQRWTYLDGSWEFLFARSSAG